MRKWPRRVKEIALYIMDNPPTEEMVEYLRWWDTHWHEEDLDD